MKLFLMVHQTADGGIFAVLVLAEVHAVHDGTDNEDTIGDLLDDLIEGIKELAHE